MEPDRFLKAIHKLRKDTRHEECFHADKSCSSNIIRAHSIQKSRILNRFAENGHVFRLALSNLIRADTELKQLGQNIASTFSGFCEYHDSKTFFPIESGDYVSNNIQQEFLFAYRALAKERSTKNEAAARNALIYEMTKSKDFTKLRKYGLLSTNDEPEWLSDMASHTGSCLSEYADSVAEHESYRKAFNKNLCRERFSKIQTCMIEWPQEYPVAVSSMFSIERDLDGNCINDFSRPYRTKPTFLTIFPQNGKTYVLLSSLRKDRNAFGFLNEITSNDFETQKIVISNMICIYVENFFLSQELWSSMQNKQQDFLELYTNTMTQKPNRLIADNDLNIFG